jgi:hypothetical protein
MEARGNSSPRQICPAVMPAAHHVVHSRGLPHKKPALYPVSVD